MTHYDLLIIGSGSGNSLPRPDLGRIALVSGDPFGGTCLNQGCIPTKMFAYSAHVARLARESGRFGVRNRMVGTDWAAIRDRIFSRIDPISAGGLDYRLHHDDNENLTFYHGHGRFTGPKQFEVGGQTITADQVVIAAGSRPAIPPIEGLDDVDYHTSDTIMRLTEFPSSITIIGSGFIAAEFATIFADLGSTVTVIARSEAMLRSHDVDVSRVFTDMFSRYVNLETGMSIDRAYQDDRGITVSDGEREVTSDILLIATGRDRNSDSIDAAAAGIDLDGDRIVVDEFQRVLGGGKVLEGVWAAGDISSPAMLKHVANAQMRAVEANLAGGELTSAISDVIPHAVFAYPQVASVGLTEKEARERHDIVIGVQKFADVAYGWAMEEGPEAFVKIIADKNTSEILGCHMVGQDSSSLIQPVIMAMSLGISAREMTRTQYWIHPALSEVVENALLQVC